MRSLLGPSAVYLTLVACHGSFNDNNDGTTPPESPNEKPSEEVLVICPPASSTAPPVSPPPKGIDPFYQKYLNLGLSQKDSDSVLLDYNDAKEKSLFPGHNRTAYMMTNQSEFFAEATGIWFNATGPTNPFNSLEETGRDRLKGYDSRLHSDLARIYPEDDWTWPRR